jgi:NDP-sugar pyrophosphorylase family protein
MQVVIPMAGIGSRFKEYGFKTNKYLLPIDLELHYMIEKAIVSLDISGPCTYFFIINEENGVDASLRKILFDICIKYGFSYSIKSVDKLTEGPASTVYTIVDALDMDSPLFVSNSDQVLDWNFAHI